jgi:hypothetical protein
MNAYPVTLSLFDDLPTAIEKPAKPERVRYVHHFRSEADNAPVNAPVTAQDDNYVSQTIAMLQFCQEIKRRGFGEYVTIGGNVDYRQAARLCNAILGRAASDRPRPETREWEIAAAYGLDRNLDRQLLAKLTPDCRKETA